MSTKNSVILFVCAFLFSSLSLFGQDDVMTPERIVQMKRISDPQLSPDGNNIAYVLRSHDEEKHALTTDIYVVNSDTGDSVQMTYHPDNDSNPRWSPDGKTLAWFNKYILGR